MSYSVDPCLVTQIVTSSDVVTPPVAVGVARGIRDNPLPIDNFCIIFTLRLSYLSPTYKCTSL